MSEEESNFNPKNPTNFNIDAQLLLIPGILIVLGVGKNYFYINFLSSLHSYDSYFLLTTIVEVL